MSSLTQLERQHLAAAGIEDRRPAGRSFYHPELDALRYFAFLLVFIAHCDYDFFDPSRHPISWVANLSYAIHGAGFSGVSLFFSLSAYLITALLLLEQDRTADIHLRAFYTRRILRIWPLYFFFLLVVRPLARLALPWEHFSGHDYAAFLLLAGNWQCMFAGWPASVAAPLWSISIEEQFYLLWPFLVRRLRPHLPVIAIVMLLVSNLTRLLMVNYPVHDTGIWCNTFARLDPFALGALLAYFLHGRELYLGRAFRIALIALGVVLLLFAGRWGDHTDTRAILSYPVEALGCILLLMAVLRPMGSWIPGRPGRALIYLGKISYGLYVYHLLFIKLMLQTPFGFWLRAILSLAATITVSAASYAWLEMPFLRWKQRFTFVHSRL